MDNVTSDTSPVRKGRPYLSANINSAPKIVNFRCIQKKSFRLRKCDRNCIRSDFNAIIKRVLGDKCVALLIRDVYGIRSCEIYI